MPFELRVLGGLGLADGNRPLDAVLVQPKRLGLLIYLALSRPARFHQRDALLGLFWPDQSEDRARNALNQALSFLRRSLGATVVPSRGADQVGVDQDVFWCDALAFRDAADRGHDEAALALYTGDLLPAFHVNDSPAFGDWLDQERRFLRDRAVGCATALSMRAEEHGDLVSAVDWVGRASALSPYDEALARRLVVLHDRTGNPARAVQVFDQYVAEIRRELDVEPSSDLVAIVSDIRSRPADGSRVAIAAPERRGTSQRVHGVQTIPRATRPLAARLPIVALFAFVAVSVAGLAWRAITPKAPVRFPLNFAGGEHLNNAPGIASAVLAISPNGRLIAYAALGDDGRAQLYLRQLDSAHSRVVDGSAKATTPFFSPDGAWLGFHANGHLWKVPVTGGTPTQIVEVLEVFGASWSTTDTIVFGAPDGRLARVSANGGDAVALSRPDRAAGERHEWPLVLADGKTVLYTSCTCDLGDRPNFMIAGTSMTGGEQRLLVAGTFPAAVIDGRLVYASATDALMAVSYDARKISVSGAPVLIEDHVTVRRSGQARAAIAATGSLVFQSDVQSAWKALLSDAQSGPSLFQQSTAISTPRYSPDGERIAYGAKSDKGEDVWIYEITSGARWQLTSGGGVNNRPEWTPDGRRVLFVTNRRGPFAMWSQPIDRVSPAAPVLELSDGAVIEGVLSPDGSILIYRRGLKGGQDVWYRQLEGDTTPRPIAADPSSNEVNPRVSPDGRWIAYTSDQSGLREVYVRPFPGGSGNAPYRVSDGGGGTPVWSRDGRRLFYTHGLQLVAAKLTPGSAFSVASRQTVFDDDPAFSNAETGGGHANFDAAPDGTHFLLVKPVGPDRPVMVVPNWSGALRARFAPAKH